LQDIELAGKALMKDGRLVIVNLNEYDSTIYVYNTTQDLATQSQFATVVQEFNKKSLKV
jgi:hypothetical protein